MKFILQLFLLFFILHPVCSFNAIDSLENLLEHAQGKNRLELLSKLAQLHRTENPTKSLLFGEEFLSLSREAGDQYEELKAYNILGITYYQLGYYETTLDYFINALQISEDLSNDAEIARSLNNLGNLFDEIGDKKKAISYYERSLLIKERVGDKRGIANTMSNIGFIYNELGATDQAYGYFNKALQIDEEEGHIEGIFASLNNIGLYYLKKVQYDSANYYFQRALSLEKEIESIYDRADFFNNLGSIYGETGKIYLAIEIFNKSLCMAENIKARSIIKKSLKGLSDMYSLSNNHELAYDYFKKYSLINDSLHNEINSRRIASIESDYKMQKKEQELQIIKKEAEIKNLILSKNEQTSYFFYAGFILLLGFVFVFYQKYKFKVKANNLLLAQNKLIETKNSNITDSINYAKGIQEAILPDLKLLENVFQENFVICKPRDIVNGDFYWFTEKGPYFIMAVVDCTGHGVPGAFMNVLGNSLLNQIILDQDIIKPSEVLLELNKRILSMLHQERFNRNNYDGMDIGIVQYHKDSGKIIFSGAKLALYIYKEGTLDVFKGNNVSLGGNYQQERFFDEHEANVTSGDSFYLLTDGIIDQFGEVTNKKFKNYRLKELLNAINQFPMAHQAKIIEDTFYQWKGNQEQTDDMLIIGVKV